MIAITGNTISIRIAYPNSFYVEGAIHFSIITAPSVVPSIGYINSFNLGYPWYILPVMRKTPVNIPFLNVNISDSDRIPISIFLVIEFNTFILNYVTIRTPASWVNMKSIVPPAFNLQVTRYFGRRLFELRRKKEIWKAEAIARKYRRLARALIAKRDKKLERIMLTKLEKMGFMKAESIDDVLKLEVEHILERRLQTIVWRKGLANTPKQARQLIVHGHIAINGRKVTWPSYLVPVDEEDKIELLLPKENLGIKQKVEETKAA